jgi:hypothetical protein
VAERLTDAAHPVLEKALGWFEENPGKVRNKNDSDHRLHSPVYDE